MKLIKYMTGGQLKTQVIQNEKHVNDNWHPASIRQIPHIHHKQNINQKCRVIYR